MLQKLAIVFSNEDICRYANWLNATEKYNVACEAIRIGKYSVAATLLNFIDDVRNQLSARNLTWLTLLRTACTLLGESTSPKNTLHREYTFQRLKVRFNVII